MMIIPEKQKNKSIAVIGVGNTILRDEGAALHLVRRLKEKSIPGSHVDFIFAETAGLGVADSFEGYDSVILLDTILTGKMPGTVISVKKSELLAAIGEGGVAGHALGLKQALEFASVTNTIPERLVLIAIVPAEVEFGESLSSQLEEAMDVYENVVLQQLELWGVQLNNESKERGEK